MSPPKVGRLVVATLALVAIYLGASLVIVPPSKTIIFNFLDERGSVTALSAVVLAMGSAFALVSGLVSTRRSLRLFWFAMSAAMGFLAMDELLMFHERIGGFLDNRTESAERGTFRNWNDIIVIGYGIVALVSMICVLPVALRYPRFLELFALAFFFYLVHTIIDSTQEPPTTMSVILEESAKLICTATLALAMLTGLFGTLNRAERL